MSNVRRRLQEKLCRELGQAEYDAIRHTTREADKLGDVDPSRKLRAIAAHAEHLRPRLSRLVRHQQPFGWRLARIVGELFSTTRHFAVDRVLSAERSYRGTLLGLHHGLDVAYLLRDVSRREDNVRLHRFCDDLIAERDVLLREAERALVWFADHPETAVTSGAKLALAPASKPSRGIALQTV